MAEENSIKLFGFEIKRASKTNDKLKSVVPPQSEDGAGYITASGSYYGQYVDIDGNNAKDNYSLIMKYRGVATHPEVDAHLQNVVTELLQNYKLDGIHFDYIRYHASGWGMNPIGLKYFLNHSASMPGIPSLNLQNKPKFSDYKKSAISKFLKKSSMRIKAYQPNCIISAAVKPNLESAHKNFGQEWDLWLDKGYIDWAVPMNYTKENKLFRDNILSIKNRIASDMIPKIIMGIGVYNQNFKSAGQKIIETKKSNFGGVSIFSYTVFKTNPIYSKRLNKYMN